MLYTTINTDVEEYIGILQEDEKEWMSSDGLQYTLNPLVEENEGEFVVYIDVQVLEPPEAPVERIAIQI